MTVASASLLSPCKPTLISGFTGVRNRILNQHANGCFHFYQNKSLSRRSLVLNATEGSAESSKSEESFPSWARPDSDEPPPWVQDEGGKGSTAQQSFEVPFFVYLLASAITAIAAIGSVFEYINQRPVFGVLNSDSIFYSPLLGFFAFTGIPMSAFLWFKSVQVANKEAEEQDRRDGFFNVYWDSFLDAYLNKDGVFDHGVNFSFAGATAMPVTSRCLSEQLDWMFSYFNATCPDDKDCFKKNGRALFMVGEIGGNDYNYPLFDGKTLDEVKPMLPGVVQTIKHAAKTVIAYGATRLVVPGNFPIGCFPVYLTIFQTNDTTAYDELHCLKELNKFAIYHNNLLRKAIDELKEEHPEVIVVYGDYYNAFLWLLSKADMLGFDQKSLQKACCGTGGDCNFDLSSMCGDPKVTICENPGERVSWDGIHLTQKAYKLMAAWLIRDIYPKLQCEYIASYSSAV